MTFAELPTTRRGDVGEAIVNDHLASRGVHVYRPGSGPHPIDRLALDRDGRAFAYDVKTYPRRYTGPFTGIDLPDYKKYLAIYPVPVLIYFVDAFEGCIYSYDLSKAPVRPPKDRGGKIYFHLCEMRMVSYLTPRQIKTLQPLPHAERYALTPKYFNVPRRG